jgi:hypothetical protein
MSPALLLLSAESLAAMRAGAFVAEQLCIPVPGMYSVSTVFCAL